MTPNDLISGAPMNNQHERKAYSHPLNLLVMRGCKMDNGNFGQALEEMKAGRKCWRKGWNGKDMFVVYQKGYPEGTPCNKNTAEAWGLTEGDLFKVEPYLQIQMANGSHAMWVPSINDVLADDWVDVG